MTVEKVFYGTKDYVSHNVKVRTLDKIHKDILYGSFMSKDKAKDKAQILARKFNVPLVKL